MPKKNSGDLKALRDEAIDLLRDLIANPAPTRDDFAKAKAAQVAIGAYSREFASANAREAMRVQMAAATLDAEERARYIQLAWPASHLAAIINARTPLLEIKRGPNDAGS